jgi:hypothetical protein
LSASTRSGRVRGRPPPRRTTRMPSNTTVNCGLSPRCPAVTTSDNGFCPCSAARWVLVVNPPRDRPSPCSAGSMSTPPGGSTCRSPFDAHQPRADAPAGRGIHTHIPGDQPSGLRAGLQTVPLPAPEQSVHRLPRPIRRRDIPPGRTDPDPPADPVDQLPFGPLGWASGSPAEGQQRFQRRPLRVGQVRPPRHRQVLKRGLRYSGLLGR